MKVVTGLVCVLLLCTAGCQTRGVFSSAQIKGMQEEGFTQQNDGWSLGLSDRILFGINESSLTGQSKASISRIAAKLSSLVIRHLRIDGYTDNYGEVSYTQQLSLKRANVVADQWSAGGPVPRENIQTRGLGMKYPVASNSTSQGRAQNRRVAIIIAAP